MRIEGGFRDDILKDRPTMEMEKKKEKVSINSRQETNGRLSGPEIQ